jgi:hypothetical protein
MRWFHTVALPLATMIAVYFGIRKKAPFWKHGALVLGCGLMLGGLWLVEEWSTILLIGGGVVFFLGIPRGLAVRHIGASVDRAPARVVGEPGACGIHISFPSPRFFMGDAQVILLLDGATIYEGGFKAGIDVTVPVAPGQHRLESAIELGIAKRRRTWEVAVPSSGCDVLLEYSRTRGNFAKGVRIGSLATAGPSAGAA